VVAEQWSDILIALVAVLVVKALVTGFLLRISGAKASVAAETGVLMSSPSETTLIVLSSAVAAKVIAPETAAFWQIVTALGLTVTPLLAKLGRLAGSQVGRQELAGAIDASLDTAAEGQVMILGFGRVGRLIADMMETHGKDYLAVDADVDVAASARKEGYDVIFGDVAHPELIERAGQKNPSAFILTMDNPVLVRRLARQLREAFPDLPIIARARDTTHAAQLYKAGVTDAVPETLEASLQLSEAALVDLGVAMGPVIASIHEKRSELRAKIMTDANLEEIPRLGRRRARDSQLSGEGSKRSTPAL
jgi:CPA2 family monovalent cation:H+ antiporter-2